jgi:septum formation protein
VKKKTPLPLVLASASPRRKKILSTFPWTLSVCPSRAVEPKPRPGERPPAYARRLALLKARAVAGRVSKGLVLGADTIVVFQGEVFGKPLSPEHAERMLRRLSGRWHRVYTGMALVVSPEGKTWSLVQRTLVKMRPLSPGAIRRASLRHGDKAGAYAAQAKGNPFVEQHNGDFDNIVGMPRRGLNQLLVKARRWGAVPLLKRRGR